jgi:hypothetical protein
LSRKVSAKIITSKFFEAFASHFFHAFTKPSEFQNKILIPVFLSVSSWRGVVKKPVGWFGFWSLDADPEPLDAVFVVEVLGLELQYLFVRPGRSGETAERAALIQRVGILGRFLEEVAAE